MEICITVVCKSDSIYGMHISDRAEHQTFEIFGGILGEYTSKINCGYIRNIRLGKQLSKKEAASLSLQLAVLDHSLRKDGIRVGLWL